jgi:HAD superfamily hydrolase (TIGR01509 family)
MTETRETPLRRLDAILWDMDGTIIDSEPYWMKAEREMTARFGLEWTEEDAMGLVGRALPASAGILQEHGVDLSIREIIDTLSARVIEQVAEEIPWRPGARELLAEAQAQGVLCALVTMSEAPFAGSIVKSLPEGTFQAVVTGDRVEHGKPAPDAYELGFTELAELRPGLSKERCLAIEDSVTGYTAATAAGLTTLAVPLHVPIPADVAEHRWSSLDGRTLADLAQVLEA